MKRIFENMDIKSQVKNIDYNKEYWMCCSVNSKSIDDDLCYLFFDSSMNAYQRANKYSNIQEICTAIKDCVDIILFENESDVPTDDKACYTVGDMIEYVVDHVNNINYQMSKEAV